MELLKSLSENDLLVVNGLREVICDGQPAIIMQRYAQGSKDVVKRINKEMVIVGESSWLNEKSISDLRKILRIMNDRKIKIDDLQFLIGKDGSIVIADPLDVIIGQNPSEWNTKMIKKLIEAAEKK